MTVGIVVTVHATDATNILRCIAAQTRLPDAVAVLYSDTSAPPMPDWDIPTTFWRRPNLSDWGHQKRDEGWRLLDTDFVAFFNADDSYKPEYLERMLRDAYPSTGFIYCNWGERSYSGSACEPRLGSSTAGNFIVARSVLESAKGWEGRFYEADGRNIERYVNHSYATHRTVTYVNDFLYAHNLLWEG